MSYILGILGKSQRPDITIRPPTSIAAPSTYDGWVNSFGTSVVSYWKFQGTGTDEKGVANATLHGSPETGVETIVDLDRVAEGATADGTCIAWTGTTTEYATASHNSAHKTANGTIVITFQCDTLNQKSVLLEADANGTAGGLSIEVNTNGSIRAYLRNVSNVPVVLTGVAGDVQLNNAYTMIFKWGTGLSLALWNDDGVLVRRLTNALTDGVTGTSPLTFGLFLPTTAAPHDGPYGRVIWLNRRITDAEEPNLARARTITREVTGEYITTPEAHGWADGNTATQNTTAFTNAVIDASTQAGTSSSGRGVVQLVPGKTYTVTTTKGTSSNSNGCIALTSSRPNVEIRTQGKPVVGGNQAIITWPPWTNYTGTDDVARMHLIKCDSASNVKIGWLTLDGAKLSTGANKTARDNWCTQHLDFALGGNGGVHNCSVSSGDSITFEQVESKNAIVDGCGVGRPDATFAPPTNILFVDCYFHHCRRQGLSITNKCGDDTLQYDQVIYRRCRFSETGDQPDMIGQQPGAGVDVEPLQISGLITGLTFDSCEFDNNHGSTYESGTIGSLDPGDGIRTDGHGNNSYWRMINCNAHDNRGKGYSMRMREDGDWNHIRFENCVGNSGNQTGNQISWSHSGSVAGSNLLQDVVITNCNVGEIFFEAELPDSGHSVTIWKGNFNPTVTTNGATTITVNNGFPP